MVAGFSVYKAEHGVPLTWSVREAQLLKAAAFAARSCTKLILVDTCLACYNHL